MLFPEVLIKTRDGGSPLIVLADRSSLTVIPVIGPAEVLAVFLVSIAASLTGALFGLGGGILIIPFLTLVEGIPAFVRPPVRHSSLASPRNPYSNEDGKLALLCDPTS